MDTTELAVLALLAIVEDERRKSRRRFWTRQWIQQRNNGRGTIHMLHNELRFQDPESFRNFTRMDEDVFVKLLSIISVNICRQDTNMRESIKPRDRLAVTLRFLATGETFQSLAYATRIAPNTLSSIIPETLQAILHNLENKCIKIPNTANEWKQVAHSFNLLWQFPHCIGAIDGKKVTFRAPRSAGAYFRDYKGHNSIVLLAIVDAHYRFLYTNVGANGRVNDGAVFNQSKLSEALQNNNLNLPPAEQVAGFSGPELPYVFVADDAFALKPYIMKPYPERGLTTEQKVYNYRLSRARRCVENAFGIMSNKFGVLLNPIRLAPNKVDTIVRACCVLHNFILDQNPRWYIPRDVHCNSVDCRMEGIARQHGRHAAADALKARDDFKTYFNSVGAVPWQQESVDAGRW